MRREHAKPQHHFPLGSGGLRFLLVCFAFNSLKDISVRLSLKKNLDQSFVMDEKVFNSYQLCIFCFVLLGEGAATSKYYKSATMFPVFSCFVLFV